MSLLSTKTQTSTIGLDVDDHEFRAVQLRRVGNTAKVIAWAVFPRQHDQATHQATAAGAPAQDEMQWASSILARRGFVGSLVTCVPRTRDCSQHVIELPPPESGAPIEQLARVEVARARKCEPNSFEMGIWSLPQRGRTNETMAVACPKPVVHDLIQAYESGGLEVAGIDLPELAIMRGALETKSFSMLSADPRIDAVLHTSWNSALAVVTLGQRIVYVRRIERGAGTVWAQAIERYRLSRNSAQAVLGGADARDCPEQLEKIRTACWSGLAKELASELDVALAYVSHGFRMAPLGSIVLAGYGAKNATLASQLDRVLGIPLIRSAPEPLVQQIGDVDGDEFASRLTLAFGLAARFDS